MLKFSWNVVNISVRKTKDLDFAIKQLSNQIDDLLRVIQSILDVRIDDGITWGKLEGFILNHPTISNRKMDINHHD